VFKDGKAKEETAEPSLHIIYISTYQKSYYLSTEIVKRRVRINA